MRVLRLETSRDSIDLFVDAAHDSPELARHMLRRDPGLACETSTWGETALQAASHLGHRELIADLVAAGARPDLFAACALGNLPLARALLSTASPFALGVHGLPVLHFGVVSRGPAMIETLLASGAPPNHPRASLPPLHSAVAIGCMAAVRLLLQAGADPGAVDAFDARALDWAVVLHGTGSPIVEMLTDAAGPTTIPSPAQKDGRPGWWPHEKVRTRSFQREKEPGPR